MSNSNFSNNPRQENYRGRSNNERSNFRDRSGGRRDGGGFRIRLSDNEMKAVKSIQETFQLRSTVAVLGFSVRTLSEMIKDEKLIESIKEYAKNNKNSSTNRQSQNSYEEILDKIYKVNKQKRIINFLNENSLDQEPFNERISLLLDPQTCGPLLISCNRKYENTLKDKWYKVGEVVKM